MSDMFSHMSDMWENKKAREQHESLAWSDPTIGGGGDNELGTITL